MSGIKYKLDAIAQEHYQNGRIGEMFNLANFLSFFRERNEEASNPLEDGSNFETFSCLQYSETDSIPKVILDNTELDNPLKIYKYLILKVYLPISAVSEFGNPIVCMAMQEKFNGFRAKYNDFIRKEIPMTSEEKKYLKSAFASLQLAELSLKIQLKEFKLEKFNFPKFKEICKDIFDCYNASGEGTVQYFFALCGDLLLKRYFQTSHFLVCAMIKIMKQTREVRTRVELVPQNAEMEKNLKQIESNNDNVKMICLHHIFINASFLQDIGPDQSLEVPKADAEIAKMLMKLFKKSDKTDEFYKIPMKVDSFEKAKKIYDLILKLADAQELRTEKHAQEARYYKALAHGNLAAFATDSAEVYRLSETSLNLLEHIRQQDNDDSSSKDVMEMIDLNLRRMWRIKLEIYNTNQTKENRIAVKEVAYKRILWGKHMTSIIEKTELTLKSWWINLDLVECALLVYSDYSCFKKFAEKIYVDLHNSPFNIPIFERASGVQFEKSMTEQNFVNALANKIHPNLNKVINPFEDGSSFEDFVSFYYDIPTEFVLANTNYNTPINIYKLMLLVLGNPLKTDEKLNNPEACAAMLEKIEDIKEKYKAFLSQKISMTDEEQKYVKVAYGTVELAELAMNIEVNKEKFKIQGFDFQKFKEMCRCELEGFVGEIPIMYLLPIFYIMLNQSYFEVARFVASVMIETFRKCEKVRAENETSLQYCACVSEVLTEIKRRVIVMQWNFLDRILSVSSLLHTIGPISKYQRPGNDKAKEKMLMQLFENYEGDHADFHKLPLKAENYEQAKTIYEMILKLAKQREEVYKLLKCEDVELFRGLAYSSFADFLYSPEEIYRLSESSNLALRKCSLQAVSKDCDHDIGHVMGAIDQNYRRMWKIKLDIYKRENSVENHNALRAIAAQRIEWGDSLCNINFNLPFKNWWILLDMLKCHSQVFKNQAAANECAESIWDGLISDTDEIKIFIKCVGIHFANSLTRKRLIKSVTDKYKNLF